MILNLTFLPYFKENKNRLRNPRICRKLHQKIAHSKFHGDEPILQQAPNDNGDEPVSLQDGSTFHGDAPILQQAPNDNGDEPVSLQDGDQSAKDLEGRNKKYIKTQITNNNNMTC
ncbi:Hypothetical predicted protein [Paramuricea clavata]|uniref:Uncharacterized protein n=1 Tax=Paramuricea clavata TaxID=317549 RepID=A0A6S7HMQ5_PARCT|nr:Hypothetical predicted protein [Paramuricea clavata]